jgi:hypothetical protein
VIVVIGLPFHRRTPLGAVADGTAVRIARAAVTLGARVELVGKAGEDAAGDEMLLALSREGIGHVALLRDPARETPSTDEDGPVDEDERVDEEDIGAIGGSVASTRSDDVGDSDPRPVLEAEDVELALRYLTEFTAVVVADPVGPDVLRVAATASVWVGGILIVLVKEGTDPPVDLPPDAIVLAAGAADRVGPLPALVGTIAAYIDAGSVPADAFRRGVDEVGWAKSGR